MRLSLVIVMSATLMGCAAEAIHSAADAGDPPAPPSSGPDASSDGATEAGPTIEAGMDAGPLGAPCDPHGGACPDGLACFGFHTDPKWGCDAVVGCQPDLYGHCYATCGEGSTGTDTCRALGGLCGCPTIQGTDAGWDCLPDGSYVCVHSTQ